MLIRRYEAIAALSCCHIVHRWVGAGRPDDSIGAANAERPGFLLWQRHGREKFDFVSFSFQVPICGFAAKQVAHPKKQSARVNPMVFVFMRAIESTFLICVNTFWS